MTVHRHDIIVIGASSGGVDALIRVIRRLPADLPASVFVVLHIAADRTSALPAILNREGRIPVVQAADGDPIRPGRVYVAPPDRHLVVRPGHLSLSSGPRENRVRPAIDVLFRTAAVAYPGRVVGVVLTGQLDDGADGLAAIKRCGGLAVVQDPSEAAAPSMPQSALDATPVDHIAFLDDIGALLGRLAELPAMVASAPVELQREAFAASGIDPPVRSPRGESAEPPHALACPECGGALREVDEETHHFRCQVGHAFNLRTLVAAHGDELERALWMALRTMEERVALYETMARHQEHKTRALSARAFADRADEMRRHAGRLRDMLLSGALQPLQLTSASPDESD